MILRLPGLLTSKATLYQLSRNRRRWDSNVSAVSGPAMLQGIAIANVNAWHFNEPDASGGQTQKATFHFALEPPADGYDEGQAITKVEVAGDGHIRVLSVATTGLNRSECPSASDREPPSAVIGGDYVEVHRWNEVVRVSADGNVITGGNGSRVELCGINTLSRLMQKHCWRDSAHRPFGACAAVTTRAA